MIRKPINWTKRVSIIESKRDGAVWTANCRWENEVGVDLGGARLITDECKYHTEVQMAKRVS